MSAPGRYCLAVCYCGRCPQWAAQQGLEPVAETIIDAHHVASGKRRAKSLAQFRAAQAAVAAGALPGVSGVFGWPRCSVCGGAMPPDVHEACGGVHICCAGIPATAADLR